MLRQYGSVDIAEAEFKNSYTRMLSCTNNTASGVMKSEAAKKRFLGLLRGVSRIAGLHMGQP